MTEYLLYLESGPQKRKTMVHVLDLPGCIANGPTTESALAATPEAIRTYLRFCREHGEDLDPDAPFETTVAEHVTQGAWLGNGSPYIVFGPDLLPLDEVEIELRLRRLGWMRETLAAWTETQDDAALDAEPSGDGRTARSILLHVLGAPASYLSTLLGGVRGFSALHTKATKGEIPLAEALRSFATLATEVVRATTPEQRAMVVQRPTEVRTLRKALRRTLEHDWEHLLELSRRAEGPRLSRE